MENKRQHIVPKAYLEAFVDPMTPLGHKPYLWVYEREGAEPYRRAPKKVAVESYYYSFTAPTGERDHAVDEMLQKVESLALPILRALDQGRDSAELSPEERMYLAHFVALLEVRVPRFRNSMEKFIGETMGSVALEAAAHPEYFERTARAASKASTGKVPSPEEIERLRQFILSKEYTLRTSPVVSLQAMVQAAPVIANYAYQYQWRLLQAEGEAAFLTSDCPFVRVTTVDKYPKWMGVGWETPYMEATLPLSPRNCLLISLHHPEGREQASNTQVQEVNDRTSAYALEEVYSSRALNSEDLAQRSDPAAWVPVTNVVRERQ